jgi:hypothetical protein
MKSDFFKILLDYIKAKGNLVVFYIEPITSRLLNPMDDDEFNVDNFVTYHLSIPIVGAPLPKNVRPFILEYVDCKKNRIFLCYQPANC